jgi:uncharacterized membrane protein
MFRALDAGKIIGTLEQLERRITERFPGAGLGRICAELTETARQTRSRSNEIEAPNIGLRAFIAAVLLVAAGLLAAVVAFIVTSTRASDDMAGTIQGIDAGLSLLLLVGASLFFLFRLEERWKRRRALSALHELRSIIHVIDMHQLTKDPSAEAAVSSLTPSSPRRVLTPHELARYLDYCSEMLSLAAKVAVLYVQSFPDPVVTEVANDLERSAAALSQKVWLKIQVLEQKATAAGGL